MVWTRRRPFGKLPTLDAAPKSVYLPMRTDTPERSAGFAWLLLAAAALMGSGGCAAWDWRGNGYRDESTGWTKQLRPAADSKKFTGLDARAQEIESNLGIR